jgi:phage shock protein B
MEEQPLFVVVMVIGILGILFVALPWLVFHYVTRWKTAATLTNEDEKLMEELYELARRLDERMCTLERIQTAENPNWRSVACDPAATGIEDRTVTNRAAERIGR